MAQRREDMRAADSDRQYVADRLREALDEGRLDLGEYDERLQRTYAARTYGELDQVLADLPGVRPPEHSQVAAQPDTAPPAGGQQRRLPPWLWAIWGTWVSVALIMIVIWAFSGGHGSFWPLWVIGPWGAVLLARTIGGIAGGDPGRHFEAMRARDQERWERRRERWERRRDRRGW